LRARLRSDLRVLVQIVAASAGAGAIYGGLTGDAGNDWTQGAVVGGAIACWCATFDLFILRIRLARPLLRLAFLPHVAVKTGWYVAGMVGFMTLGEVAFGDAPGGGRFGLTIAFSLLAALAFNFLLMLNRMLGQNVLFAFLTGRYHRPREEERIFLFADLAASTATAERIGPARFHQLLNDVAMDLTDPVLDAQGEIHAYVGDEVIVTWKLERGLAGAACVQCCLEAQDRLAAHADEYRRRYGLAPRMRMALHSGAVIAGELGDVKRQIVFLGDVVNATARLEQACRELGRDLLVSGDLLGRMALPTDVRAEALGPILLRGRSEPTEVFALARGPA